MLLKSSKRARAARSRLAWHDAPWTQLFSNGLATMPEYARPLMRVDEGTI
jgi:hypothetical protein